MENDERRKYIGRQLQRLRKDAGYKSAASFAKTLGVKTGTYTSYEQGEAGFSIERAWDMADALKVTLDELVGRDWPPGGPPALTPDERGLVDSYRLMDGEQRGRFSSMAGTFVMASEKDGPEHVGAHERAGRDVVS